MNFLNNGGGLEEINNTYIVLIPKVKNTSCMVDFRPSNLFNVIYQIISKTIVNRLKKVFPDIIDESQSGFEAGK